MQTWAESSRQNCCVAMQTEYCMTLAIMLLTSTGCRIQYGRGRRSHLLNSPPGTPAWFTMYMCSPFVSPPLPPATANTTIPPPPNPVLLSATNYLFLLSWFYVNFLCTCQRWYIHSQWFYVPQTSRGFLYCRYQLHSSLPHISMTWTRQTRARSRRQYNTLYSRPPLLNTPTHTPTQPWRVEPREPGSTIILNLQNVSRLTIIQKPKWKLTLASFRNSWLRVCILFRRLLHWYQLLEGETYF